MSKSAKSASIESPGMLTDEGVFTPKELAVKWRVSDDTILRLCRAKKLSHIRIGGKVLIPFSAAEVYLRQHTTLA